MQFLLKYQKYWKAIAMALSVIGLLMGEISLNMAMNAQPPMTWASVGAAGIFSALGMIFILKVQVAKKNWKEAYGAWVFFFFNGLYFFSAGFSALVISLYKDILVPSSLMFIVIGTGVFVGLVAMKSRCIDKKTQL